MFIFKKDYTHSWLQKEESRKMLNIGFSSSTSLITAIMFTRKVFAAGVNESVNSEVFIKFVEKLKDFTRVKDETSIDRYFIILDNVVTNCSINMREYLKTN